MTPAPDRSPLAVVIGRDPDAAAAVAHAAIEAGARATVFVGDPADPTDRAALIELIGELA
jgi:hypothetical protein